MAGMVDAGGAVFVLDPVRIGVIDAESNWAGPRGAVGDSLAAGELAALELAALDACVQ
ncbi:hypothetical protein ACU4GD_40395 [Cupriavidus basilensis]